MTEVGLAAVQLAVSPAELASGDRYRAAILAAGEAAASRLPAGPRLLVFPEACGHLAPLALGPAAARSAPTLGAALAAAALRRPLGAVRGLLSAQTPSPTQAVLRALAPEAELWMHVTFAAVARRCRATVVGGSFLRARADGAVTNTSCTYDPEGRCVATTDKVNLVPGLEDRRPGGLGLARGRAAAVPVVDAGWGRLATAICYDGFVEPHTRDERFEPVPPRLDAAGVDVVANPAANPWPWHAPWVHAEPAPADRGADGVAVISRAEQWAREGLPAALAAMRHARWGITAHLVARVLDVAFEGASEILRRDGDRVAVVARAAAHDAGEAVTAVVGVAAPGGRA